VPSRDSYYNGAMILAALVALCGTAPTVSFHSNGLPTKALVQVLADLTGRRLSVDALVGAEPIVADLQNVGIDPVLAKLAEVLGAEWIDQGNERKLTRTSVLRAKQAREDRAAMAVIWKKLIGEGSARAASLPKFDEREAERLFDGKKRDSLTQAQWSQEVAHLSTTNPAARAVAELMATLSPEAIAQMELGERKVYSDAATRTQVQLPAKTKSTLSSLMQRSNLLLSAKERAPSGGTRIGGFPEVGPGRPEDYGKTVFAIRKVDSLRLLYSLVVVDREGQRILRASGNLPDSWAASATLYSIKGSPLEITKEIRALAKLSSEAGVASASGRPVVLPDGTRTFASQWTLQSEIDGEPVDRGQGALLSDPVANDPIGYVFGRLMRQAANRRKRNLLATVPDSALFPLARDVGFNQIGTEEALFESLDHRHLPEGQRMPSAVIEEDERWLLVRPAFPSVSQQTRFNRLAAKELIAAIRGQGSILIENAVRYISKTPSLPAIRSIDAILIAHANPNVDRTGVHQALQTPIEFLAAAGPSGWQALVGRTLPYSDLSPNLKQIVSRWVFWSSNLERQAEMAMPEMQPTKPPPGPLAYEPTEIFPAGLPPQTPIRISVLELPAVVARSSSNNTFNLSIYSLAWADSFEDPFRDDAKVPAAKRVLETFRPATQRQYTITLHLPNGLTETRSIVETVPRPGAAEFSRGQLPDFMLQELEAAKKLLRQPIAPPPPRRPPKP
jgi:hypothetical protein